MAEVTDRRRRAAWLLAIAVSSIVAGFPLMHSADAAPTASRIAGADRYATAAAVSAQSFSPGVPAVYLATGETFPDALAGTPVAAKAGGPVLLTQRDTLPASTAAELDRLNPTQIIVLGGTTAVSQAVQDQLAPYATGTVTRIQGANRYATAAAISAATFSPAVSKVYVATGGNFPDALAGGPAAANAAGGGGPILLVGSDTIPPETATELQRLAAQSVIILGGTTAVSDTVKNALENYSVDPVARRAGENRYLTSVAVSNTTFSTAPKVYLATGANFPDALAGGSPAGIAHGPVLLSGSDCIPPEVDAEITRLNPESLIVLGGEAVLSNAVMNRTVCVPPSTTTTTFPTPDCGTIPIPGCSTSTSFTTTPPQQGVTAGEVCSPAGASGFTSEFTPMTCSTVQCNGTPYDQPRWRQTTC